MGSDGAKGYALDQLQLGPEDCAVELGFGGALTMPQLLRSAASVCGVDRSKDIVAARRFADAVRAGRAEFLVGTVENLPLLDAAFDKALSVHIVYFWQSLGAGSAELARILASGWRVVLGFLPKAHMDRMNMPADIFTPCEPDELIAALQGAGFSGTEGRRPNAEIAWLVATGVKMS